ncbi:MAG: ankyrin repeat domain-containing protein [Nocardioidaceae bacterium]|nr:ankyrin repeat domain-containing protein [Nocardioidaceae bacterium]NUS51858.1 ankyrin repeat domain-containing protein [Nocardioidaceae bacterium]
MTTISPQDPVAEAVVTAIRTGRVDELRRLLAEHPDLAAARVGDDSPEGLARSLLHVATDWPGHVPDVATTVAVLVAAGADVNARFHGPHRETPLHWAASSDDVDALTALVEAGADIDADGGVIAGGTPLGDATALAQWNAARALVDRGARTTPFDLAALGMTSELLTALDDASPDELGTAFWAACHGGRLDTAKALADRGADLDWLPGWERATPLDAATRSGSRDVVDWLRSSGAHTYDGLSRR